MRFRINYLLQKKHKVMDIRINNEIMYQKIHSVSVLFTYNFNFPLIISS